MSHVHVCRLCTNICDDALSLCDTNGSFTEVYEIAIKFFHPKFLNVEHSTRNHLDVICFDCWHHISGFHNFQQTVLLVQAKLLKDAEEAKSTTEILTTNGIPVKDEQEFVPVEDVEMTNIPSKNQLIVTDCTLQFEADIGSLLERRINTKIDIPSDVILVDEYTLSEGDDDFEEPLRNSSVGCNERLNSADENSANRACISTVSSETNDDHEVQRISALKGGEEPLRNSSVGGNERLNTADENSATRDTISTVSSETNDDHEGQRILPVKAKKPAQEDNDIFIAQWRPILKCDLCNEPCATFTLLQKHFREIHPETQCYIVCCKKKFKYPCRIKDHIRIHMDPDFYKCKFCQKTFASKYSLDTHIFYIHHNGSEEEEDTNQSDPPPNPLKCEFCDKTFQFPSALRTHLSIHKAQNARKCSYCPATFKFRSTYRNHLMEAHPDKSDVSDDIVGRCKLCSKIFTYHSGLYHHTRVHHPEEFAKRRRKRRHQ